MSNPDNTQILSVDVLSFAIPIAFMFILLIFYIFQIKDLFISFNLFLWIGLPIIAYITVVCVNLTTQYLTNKKFNTGRAFIGAVPVFVTMLIGLGISTYSWCRIPIASVFAPLVIGQSVDITKNISTNSINAIKSSNNKKCCTPKLMLESIENEYPSIKGISYGFYSFFSIMFGIVLGNGYANVV